MPTRKALRHSRRRNIDLRVFFFDFEIYASLLFRISHHFPVESRNATYELTPFASTRLGSSKKIPSVTNTYDTRLISVLAGQMPQAAYLDPSKDQARSFRRPKP